MTWGMPGLLRWLAAQFLASKTPGKADPAARSARLAGEIGAGARRRNKLAASPPRLRLRCSRVTTMPPVPRKDREERDGAKLPTPWPHLLSVVLAW